MLVPHGAVVRQHKSLVAVLLAILIPAVVLGWTLVQLRQPPSLHGYAADMEAKLEGTDPQVIILGSSMAHRGINLDLLAHELGLRTEQVVLLQLPHASAAHWYAMLENRVFAHGYHPKLVIVAGAMTTMLNHDLLKEEANVDRLIEQMSEDEPVLARKVLHFDDPEDFRADYMRERAGEWRADLLNSFRNGVVTLFFSKRKRLDDGERLAEKVDEVVFANDRMDYGLHRSASDGLHDPGLYAKAAPDEAFDLRRDALLSDMQALVDAHQARLVWVRMPFPPSNPHMDDVPEEIEQDALDWMEELGSGWLDLRALDLDDSDFEDMRHLSKQGALKFTVTLARSLNALGALREDGGVKVVQSLQGVAGPFVDGALPAAPAVEGTGCLRTARSPELAALALALSGGLGVTVPQPIVVKSGDQELLRGPADGTCSGTWAWRDGALVIDAKSADAAVSVAWRTTASPVPGSGPVVWVWPGTTVRYDVDHAWDLPPRAFQVSLRALAMSADKAAAHVRVLGQELDVDAHGARMYGVLGPNAPDQPWSLGFQVPVGAPPVLLHHLAVGAAPATATLLGAPETMYGGSVRFIGGRVEDTFSTAVYDAAPKFAPVDVEVRKAPQKLGQIALPRLTELADSPDSDSLRPNDCSPVRVLEDGVVLPVPHAVCQDVLTKGQGRYCHAGETVYVSSTDDTSPLNNGRSYSMALDPTRACATWTQARETTLRGSWWLYPGDAGQYAVPTRRLATFREGANLLELSVIPHVADPKVALRLVLLADGQPVMDVPWTLSPGTRRPHNGRFAIDPPLPVGAKEVVLRVENPDESSFVLVSMATLSESYDGFGPQAALFEAQTAGPTTPIALAKFERTGVVPTFPQPRPGVASEGTPGAFESRLFASWPFSNSALEKLGAPQVSPLQVAADGAPLRLVTAPRELNTCGACFLHMGQAVVFTAPGGEAAALTASLDPSFPLVVADGTEAWWLFPGQTAFFEVDAPKGTWDIRLAVNAVHTQKDKAADRVSLVLGGQTAGLGGATGPGAFGSILTGVQGGKRLRVGVANNGTGYVLIDQLSLVGKDASHVILPRAAGQPR
jgi:hypothetical protein